MPHAERGVQQVSEGGFVTMGIVGVVSVLRDNGGETSVAASAVKWRRFSLLFCAWFLLVLSYRRFERKEIVTILHIVTFAFFSSSLYFLVTRNETYTKSEWVLLFYVP